MRIGEVSHLLGVPAQTIRYYEKEGFVHPVRVGDGDYRDYQPIDIINLMHCVRYRHQGYGLKRITSLNMPESREQKIAAMREVLAETEEELRKKEELRDGLRRQLRELEILPMNAGMSWLERRPAMNCLVFEHGGMWPRNEDAKMLALFERWMAEEPFAEVGLLLPLENSREGNLRWYMVTESKQAQESGMLVTVQEGLCLTTVLDITDEKKIADGEAFQEALRRAAELSSLPLRGSACASLFLRETDEQAIHRFFKVMVPIEQ